MATFTDLKTAVSRRLLDANNTAVSAEDIGDTINASIKFWKHKHFWFNAFSEDITFEIDDPEIPLPQDVTMFRPFRKNGLVITYQGRRYEVKPKRPQEYDAENVETPGMPYIRTFRGIVGGQALYQAYYYPDQEYDATWYGLKDYDDLAADDSHNDFTDYADRLILFDSVSRCLVEFRQDDERAATFASGAQAEYDNLKSTTQQLTGTGVLEVETIL